MEYDKKMEFFFKLNLLLVCWRVGIRVFPFQNDMEPMCPHQGRLLFLGSVMELGDDHGEIQEKGFFPLQASVLCVVR